MGMWGWYRMLVTFALDASQTRANLSKRDSKTFYFFAWIGSPTGYFHPSLKNAIFQSTIESFASIPHALYSFSTLVKKREKKCKRTVRLVLMAARRIGAWVEKVSKTRNAGERSRRKERKSGKIVRGESPTVEIVECYGGGITANGERPSTKYHEGWKAHTLSPSLLLRHTEPGLLIRGLSHSFPLSLSLSLSLFLIYCLSENPRAPSTIPYGRHLEVY